MIKNGLKTILLFMAAVLLCTACQSNDTSNSISSSEEKSSEASLTDTVSASESVEVSSESAASESTEDTKETKEEALVYTFTAEEINNAVTDTAFPSTAGQLKVLGTQLCSEDGKPVQLRGVSTHGIQWFPDYVNQDLFNELHTEWNANAIRLALYTAEYDGYCNGGDQEKLKELMLTGVEYAKNADIYAIIDWHTMRDGDPTTYQDEAVKFFDEISLKCKDYENVIYEICNEPNTVPWKVIREYAMKVIPVIRNNDPDAVILIGTPIYCKAPTEVKKAPITEYDNLMYDLHFYAASHQKSIQVEVDGCIKAGIPLFVSEFGICSNTGTGSLNYEWGQSWIDLLNANGISYMCWQLSNKHESSSLIKEECTKVSGFEYDDLSEHGQWLRDTLSRDNSDKDTSGKDISDKDNSDKDISGKDISDKDTVSE